MNSESSNTGCLLCSSDKHSFFFRDKFREYRLCADCNLVFVPDDFHISREREKARYDEHNNDPDDKGYREFLARIIESVRSRVPDGATGLDFGCGPTPVLADMFGDHGFPMETYDLFYDTDKRPLDANYGFIVSTEVIEHLSKPLEVFEKLLSMLIADGILAVMTRLYDDSIDFRGWHYKNDATHICFYSVETFDWLSEHLGLKYTRSEKDIFVFEKQEDRPRNTRKGTKTGRKK